MTQIKFPDHITGLLSRLTSAGYEAYAVGGCIRDGLLGREPEDWDVTTSALPGQTMELFGDAAVPTGLKHGTVTVRAAGAAVEVTTFRADGKYSDHRRPDSVRFVGRVDEDLARRDFTVNAMAMGLDGVLIDLFDGKGDLERGLIRCVGRPERRFEEDALRMFRALRFSAKLGFGIEGGTMEALRKSSGLAAGLAAERIEAEISKMLLFPCAGQLETLFSSGLMDSFCPRAELEFKALEELPADRLCRWGGMCAILAHGGLIEPRVFLQALRCDSRLVKSCSDGLDAEMPESDAEWKRLIHTAGRDGSRCAAAKFFTEGRRSAFDELDRVLSGGDCIDLSQLKVRGSDLARLGYRGRDIGAALERLLIHVWEYPQDNDRERLLSLL